LIWLVRLMRQVRRRFKLVELKMRGCQVDWTATVHPSAVFELSGGTISIGERAYIDRGVILRAMGGRIEIGSDCSVNAYSFLSGCGGLYIRDQVMIGSHVSMYASNHVFTDLAVPMRGQGLSLGSIEIEPDVWVGTGVRILAGVRIGTGSVLAAGAVVTKSTEPYSINGGVPSRRIGSRKPETVSEVGLAASCSSSGGIPS